MARPTVKFIEIKDLPLGLMLDNGAPTGIRVRLLSEDKDTGAISYVATVPPQWSRLTSGYYEAPLEMLILEGDLSFGENHLTPGCYSYLPAGAVTGPGSSCQGATFLMLFDAKPVFREAEGSRPGTREDLRIDCLDTEQMEWEVPPGVASRSQEEIVPGLFVKWLRVDPETTAYTLLTRHVPGWSDPRPEAHTNWEELLLVEGDYLMGTYGMMTAGGYIWHPANIFHGPQATKTGAIWFGRGDRMTDFSYQDAPWAHKMIAKYLEAPAIFDGLKESRSIIQRPQTE
ncbi:MAG TPA: DUF4437 domain-containing protein [Blastocatellia bacterium]